MKEKSESVLENTLGEVRVIGTIKTMCIPFINWIMFGTVSLYQLAAIYGFIFVVLLFLFVSLQYAAVAFWL